MNNYKFGLNNESGNGSGLWKQPENGLGQHGSAVIKNSYKETSYLKHHSIA